jgi:hypothetical protein
MPTRAVLCARYSQALQEEKDNLLRSQVAVVLGNNRASLLPAQLASSSFALVSVHIAAVVSVAGAADDLARCCRRYVVSMPSPSLSMQVFRFPSSASARYDLASGVIASSPTRSRRRFAIVAHVPSAHRHVIIASTVY